MNYFLNPHGKFAVFLILYMMIMVLYSCKTGKEEPAAEEVETVKKIPESHKGFIARFYPGVVEANKKVMVTRAEILNLRNDYRHVMIKGIKKDWLNKLAEEYKYDTGFFNSAHNRSTYIKLIDSLLRRVDMIPEKLVMAQAIIESGWGNSKFAKEINNYFGIHCYTKGCGRAPTGVENPKFYVKAFPTIEDCVEEYIWLLNSGFAYEGLRERRLELRRTDNFPDAVELAKGLTRYSEKGNEYVKLVSTIITNYLPDNLSAFVAHIDQNAKPDTGS